MKKMIGMMFLIFGIANIAMPEKWWEKSVMYEVFVRSFYDSDGNGIGDLKGLTQKLDYLNDNDPKTTQDLGVDGLWLMPIFDSPSYHGYDTVDYMKIEPDYGTMEDFDKLISEAHKRGIKIVLDLVINHTSTQHPWFKASQVKDPKYDDYYIWSADVPTGGWGRPWGGGQATDVWCYSGARSGYYYAAFWSGMPDLNYRSASVNTEIRKIAKFWLDKGVDGFRLDAARYLIEDGPGAGQSDSPSTIQWWKDFNAYVKSVNPDAMLVGEVWVGNEIVTKYYGDGKGLDLCFDFETAGQILQTLGTGFPQSVRAQVEKKVGLNAPLSFYAPFLANHDQLRAFNVLNKDFANAKLAAVLLLTLPGTPFLYYGEEIALYQNDGYSDENKRTPMQWSEDKNAGFTTGSPWQAAVTRDAPFTVASQLDNRFSLLTLYSKLIQIRKENSELWKGNIRFYDARKGTDSTSAKAGQILCFERTLDTGERCVVALNASKSVKNVYIDALKGSKFKNCLFDIVQSFPDGKICLDGKSFLILKETK